jgi:hypothetical protein
MAIQLEANYSKKLGLPGYSSHQYSVTIRTELIDIKTVEAESSRLYALLQGCVDRDIQQTGFLPVNGSSNGNGIQHNANHGTNGKGLQDGQREAWACSEKQRALITKIVEEHHLDKHDVDTLAQDRFGKGVKRLNRMEASGLIEELLETHGGITTNGRTSRFQNSQKARTA